MEKTFNKAYGDGLFSEILAGWIVSEHLERFENMTVSELAEAYVGVYSARPTSWLAALARNRNLNQAEVISMENSSELVRVPGMRRSKFLLPQSLAAIVFDATRLPLVSHEWRLRDAGFKLADFHRILPELMDVAKSEPVRLKDLKDSLGLTSAQVRACTTVATYDGKLIRTPSPNFWSNRWLYVAAPDGLFSDEVGVHDREQLQRDITNRYIENYGPVSVDDLAWWLAVSKKTARSLMEASGTSEIYTDVWISSDSKDRFARYVSQANKCSNQDVWFLPAWDPLLMGYAPNSKQRSCLGLDLIGGYDSSGNGRPVALIGGRAVTTWQIVPCGKRRCLQIDFTHVAPKDRVILQKAAVSWSKRIGVTLEKFRTRKEGV